MGLPAENLSKHKTFWQRLDEMKGFLEAERASKGGRPTLCTEEKASQILKYLAQGNYIKTACEAAGVSYFAAREWIVRGNRDGAAGNTDSPYFKFAEALTHAQALAEQGLVETVRVNPDWRAQAFLLERGPGRDRWGKQEIQQQNNAVIVIPAESLANLTEALAVAARRPLPVVVDVEASRITDVMSTQPDTTSCGQGELAEPAQQQQPGVSSERDLG